MCLQTEACKNRQGQHGSVGNWTTNDLKKKGWVELSNLHAGTRRASLSGTKRACMNKHLSYVLPTGTDDFKTIIFCEARNRFRHSLIIRVLLPLTVTTLFVVPAIQRNRTMEVDIFQELKLNRSNLKTQPRTLN